MTTGELDRLAESHIRDHGGIPSFKGYSQPPFPATICASVNDEVVHGIPGDRVLRDGDVISIDCGAIVDGWHGDAAITVPIGEVAPETLELLRVTEEALWRGHGRRPPRRAGRATSATPSSATSAARAATASSRTTPATASAPRCTWRPTSPTTASAARGPTLVEGLALAVEPMVTLGSKETDLLEDEWTVATVDGSMAAHFEHTFTLTPAGAWVLTAVDGGAARLAGLGAPYGGR